MIGMLKAAVIGALLGASLIVGIVVVAFSPAAAFIWLVHTYGHWGALAGFCVVGGWAGALAMVMEYGHKNWGWPSFAPMPRPPAPKPVPWPEFTSSLSDRAETLRRGAR